MPGSPSVDHALPEHPRTYGQQTDRVRTRISDCGCCGLAKLVIAALAGTALDPPDDRIVMTRLLQERGGTGRGARHSLRLGKPRPGPLAFRGDIIDVMRTVVDIDEVLLDRAAAQLGTKTKVDTVRAALAYVAEIPDRDRAIMESRYAFGTPDLVDPEIMAGARR